MKEGGFNFHELHEERNVTRDTVKDLDKDGGFGSSLKEYKEGLEQKHKDFRISDYGGLSEAKREIRYQRETFDNKSFVIDWEAIRKELGAEDYNLLDDLEKKSDSLRILLQSQAKRLREMSNNPKKTELYKSLIRAVVESIGEKKKELNNLESENLEISRIRDLLSYREELFEEGHIAEVPSVENYLSKIEEAMIEGKPMFLHGPTGTGKTSLAIRAAKVLTDKDPEIIYCNPQSKESNIFGKTGIGIDEKTEKQITKFDPAPLIRAMKEGSIVIFDEFTALPKDMMVMLKGIMNAKPGDRRTVTGDGEITIATGFQMIFTANLKSEKNPERQELPPEMANEFSQNNLEIKYQTADESYDIMLARLMNQDGSINMSEYDMEVTLKKFAEAIVEIQKTYTEGNKDDLGGNVSLKKFVLNQRNIENILSRWKTVKVKGDSSFDFVDFLDKQLAVTLTFRDFSEKDRELASKILARHGLLSTVKAEELSLPSGTFSYNPDISLQALRKSGDIKRYTLRDVAVLDPFNLRRSKISEDVEEVLGTVENNTFVEQSNLEQDLVDLTFYESSTLDINSISPKDILEAKEPTNIKAGLWSDSDFNNWIRPYITQHIQLSASPVPISSYTLDRNMKGEELNNKLGKAKPFTIEEFATLINNQSELDGNSPKTKSPLDTSGKANLFLMEKSDGSRVVVGAYWNSGGRKWNVYANGLAGEWSAGRRVFSRNN